MFALDKAVKLKPNNSNIQFNWGLARALTGDCQGAIEDFQVFLDSSGDGEQTDRVEGWIETFKKREKSFTNDVLEKLKKYDFWRVH